MYESRKLKTTFPARSCRLLVNIALSLLFATGVQAASASTKFGVYYAVWHCPVAQGNADGRPIHDIARILRGQQAWGPVPEFHWWNKPAAGYYCLSTNDALLKRHAVLLRDAGIDFIYVDATNWPYADNRDHLDSRAAVIEPYNELLKVWSKVPNAPKVVPWAPLTSDSTLLQYLLGRLDLFPNLKFLYQSKPLVLAVGHDPFPIDAAKLTQLSAIYAVRKMWALFPQNPADSWTFLQACVASFQASHGNGTCRQNYALRDGAIEEIPIAGAYQSTYISQATTAMPRLHGRTFAKQFETVSDHPNTPIALIYSWNEWIAQRFCFNAAGETTGDSKACSTDHFPDGSKIFVDEYAEEYSKDIEPLAEPPRDRYYQLMKACIALYRQGAKCSEASVPLSEHR
jgi:hypothetical protein